MCLLEDDWVYHPDEREREEYVMKEDGIIYYGASNFPRPMTWAFGQVSSAEVRLCFRAFVELVLENELLSPHEKMIAFCHLITSVYLTMTSSCHVNHSYARNKTRRL